MTQQQTNDAKPSAGAMKAANAVIPKIHLDGAAGFPCDVEQVASIIDRHTAHRELVEACKAALYLMGSDADRHRIGERPWLPYSAEHTPHMLRQALAAAGEGEI